MQFELGGIFASLTVEENLLLPRAVSKEGMPLAEIYRMFPNLEQNLRFVSRLADRCYVMEEGGRIAETLTAPQLGDRMHALHQALGV